ncbi:hypothetical protein [Rhizobium oryzicola]|uniref:REase AHJR-like domain-containing protein n=1 Tax=Rhizobium oryzicola TaxID=1232668 RepID=A0ABT8SSF3_9HYPH|nr:hypothetical protein [Rhizobium oryzicola]MDO1581309.1 hypothetical protein [Rhizobium oryzicola]
MTISRTTEAEIFSATAAKLAEQGYDVIAEPTATLLPEALKAFRPDGIAIGKDPKLVIQIAGEGPQYSKRVADLQKALKDLTGWKLHLVVGTELAASEIPTADDASILLNINRARRLLEDEPEAALLIAWATLEAISRSRRPAEFARAQSPGRIIERLANEGVVTASEASSLRAMAVKRNAFIHGDLQQAINAEELARFLQIIGKLMNSQVLRTPPVSEAM